MESVRYLVGNKIYNAASGMFYVEAASQIVLSKFESILKKIEYEKDIKIDGSLNTFQLRRVLKKIALSETITFVDCSEVCIDEKSVLQKIYIMISKNLNIVEIEFDENLESNFKNLMNRIFSKIKKNIMYQRLKSNILFEVDIFLLKENVVFKEYSKLLGLVSEVSSSDKEYWNDFINKLTEKFAIKESDLNVLARIRILKRCWENCKSQRALESAIKLLKVKYQTSKRLAYKKQAVFYQTVLENHICATKQFNFLNLHDDFKKKEVLKAGKQKRITCSINLL